MKEKIFKARVMKPDSILKSTVHETWFAVKGKGLQKSTIKEFRNYLNDCVTEFMSEETVVVQNDAADKSPTPPNTGKGEGKIGQDEKGW
jgi:hypothetical protein